MARSWLAYTRSVRALGCALVLLAVNACGDDAGDAGDAGSDASIDSGGLALCRPGETNCGGECADFDTNVDHCGGCNMPCTAPDGALPLCEDGVCGIDCNPPSDEDAGVGDAAVDAGVDAILTPCGNACFDLEIDLLNCGACDNACHDPDNGDPTCADGTCDIECDAGYELCGDECYNLLVDGDHCGACGTACGTNEVCANGDCVLSCPSGQARCGNSCVEIESDADNCGGCGNVCPDPANGDPACSSGACDVACDTNFSDCGGACVNRNVDENHCGACGNQCSTVHGTPTCTSGSCDIACDANFDDCDNDVDTGCEADLTSEATCGDCGTACGGLNPPYCSDATTPGTYVCEGTCGSGETACPTISPDHCADLTTDEVDCGMCGNVCDEPASGDATGDAACGGSSCGVDCIMPTDDEVTRGGNLACVDNSVDPQACGSSLEQCGKGERCLAGVCTPDECAVGLTNTDSGCVNLDSDDSNCGEPDGVCADVGGPCALPAVNCVCDAGECHATCSGGREACGDDCADTDTDPAHCGACDNACDPGEFCKGGMCRNFIYASGAWECGADNAFPDACMLGNVTVCVADGSPCP